MGQGPRECVGREVPWSPVPRSCAAWPAPACPLPQPAAPLSCVPSSGEGVWSNQGCVLAEGNLSYSVCRCTHLTNFAILMQVVPLEVRARRPGARTRASALPTPGRGRLGRVTCQSLGRGVSATAGWTAASTRQGDPVIRDIWEALLLWQTEQKETKLRCKLPKAAPVQTPGPSGRPVCRWEDRCASILCLRSPG